MEEWEDMPGADREVIGLTGGSEQTEAKQPIIGTLQESGLHRGLKAFYEPEEAFWEQPLGRFVADVFDGRQITEIQTGHFAALREKLIFYAAMGLPVRVVYPLRVKKKLIFQDEDGVFLRFGQGRSDKPLCFLEELNAVADLLDFSFVTLDLAFVAVTEQRISYPNRAYGKRRKLDVALDEVKEVRQFKEAAQLLTLLPPLPEVFTRADLKRAAKCTPRTAACACLALEKLGLAEQAGKQGRAFQYRIKQ